MPEPAVTISSSQLTEDRYSRFRLIHWWDQEKIAAARVLVVGAGALGNEILKNLALLGFRNVLIVDLDNIELSNLSRTVLYSDADIGKSKAAAAAGAFQRMAPEARVHGIDANIISSVGLGVFLWADVVLGGLDNREARLWINRAAWKTKRPWVDGAIEGVNGVARVFLPGKPACYECTLGETDWELLERRMSCNLLTREDVEGGKVATTPTTSSIIAGIQVQEAVKQLHGMPTLAGKGFVFEGLHHTSYVVEYSENPDCQSHYSVEEIVALPERGSALRVQELWERACRDLGSRQVTLEFSRDVIQRLSCPTCDEVETLYMPLGRLRFAEGKCMKDGAMRRVETIHNYTGAEDYGDRTLDQLGLPAFDLFTARSDKREVGYLIEGDSAQVLGAAGQSLPKAFSTRSSS
ncbi:MAG TPA: ThiF family adenylyltransferase [Terriglobales bacterium]|nr:ThiF family adenylyltransferase [Terriglobales bacterium]